MWRGFPLLSMLRKEGTLELRAPSKALTWPRQSGTTRELGLTTVLTDYLTYTFARGWRGVGSGRGLVDGPG